MIPSWRERKRRERAARSYHDQRVKRRLADSEYRAELEEVVQVFKSAAYLHLATPSPTCPSDQKPNAATSTPNTPR